MQFLKDYPVTLFLFSVLSGILITKGYLIFPVILFLTSAIVILYYFRENRNYKFILFIYFLCFSEPFILKSFSQNELKYPFKNYFIKECKVKGVVDDFFVSKENRIDIILDDISVVTDTAINYPEGKILFRYYPKSKRILDSLDLSIQIDDTLNFFSQIKIPPNNRNLGEFNYREYLLKRDIVALGKINAKKELTFTKSDKVSIFKFVNSAKRALARRIDNNFNKSSAAFIKGILLAERSFISNETKEDFINSGVIHVLAVSGLHVGIIFLILNSLFGRLDVRIRYSLVILSLLLFAFITGFPSSVLRAETMAVIYVIAKLTARDKNSFNILFLTGLIILLVDNNQLFNTGFQFSFLSVFFILVGLKISYKIFYLFRIRNTVIKGILTFIFVSLFAQIGTLPLSIIYFNRVSLIALLSNMVVIPLVGILLPLAIVAIAFTYLSAIIALPYIISFEKIFGLMSSFIDYVSGLDFSHLTIYNFDSYKVVLFYISVVIGFYFIINSYKKREIILSGVAIIISLFITFRLPDSILLKEGLLNIVALDVGQGDSFFIKFPNGKTALIDAGNRFKNYDSGKDVIYPFLLRNNVDKINYAFLSHVDGDHYLGYYYLAGKGIIDTLYKPSLVENSEKDLKFEKFLKDKGIKVFYYKDTSLTLGNCKIYFLQRNSGNKNLKSMNDNSGVLKIVYGNNTFLFTGDAGKLREKVITENYSSEFLKSGLLKLAHHGSKHSSSDEFLETVSPENVIISCGLGNSFNHPAKSVLNKIMKYKAGIYRTDYNGMLFFTSDGDSIRAINWRLN